jgi:DNA repair protein RecO (recombination protein O)
LQVRRATAAMRVENEPAFVLESRPYRETSALLELLTAGHGRVAVVARGIRAEGGRQASRRAVLEPFRCLHVGFSGRGEVMTLTTAETGQAPLRPVGPALFAAMYVNELVLRLTARSDPAPALFDRYGGWLDELAALLAQAPAAAPTQPMADRIAEALPAGSGEAADGAVDDGDLGWSLRRFERDLLGLLGYAPGLQSDGHTGLPLEPGRDYALDPEHGAVPWSATSPWPRASGATLLAWAGERRPDPVQARALKQLARALLRHHLGGGELRSWRLAAQWRMQTPR